MKHFKYILFSVLFSICFNLSAQQFGQQNLNADGQTLSFQGTWTASYGTFDSYTNQGWFDNVGNDPASGVSIEVDYYSNGTLIYSVQPMAGGFYAGQVNISSGSVSQFQGQGQPRIDLNGVTITQPTDGYASSPSPPSSSGSSSPIPVDFSSALPPDWYVLPLASGLTLFAFILGLIFIKRIFLTTA